jgi:hypothetical protein
MAAIAVWLSTSRVFNPSYLIQGSSQDNSRGGGSQYYIAIILKGTRRVISIKDCIARE